MLLHTVYFMAMEKSDTLALSLISLSVVIAIGIAGWLYLYKKDYVFVVEASCDPTATTCFVRDCSNPDDCPPNGLTSYKVFQVKAKDFEKCTDDSCQNECLNGTISCTEVKCGESGEDSCSDNPIRPTE